MKQRKLRTMADKRLDAIRDAREAIQYNIQNGLFTSGQCCRGCGRRARGAGRCVVCAEADLAAIIGAAKARRYVAAVRQLRKMEYELDAIEEET